MHILIVEDDLEIQNSLRIFLENEKYEITIVGDGLDALTVFDDKFDLVLLDVMLPSLNGFDVCKQIRTKSNVPIVMLTALQSENDQIKGFDLNIDDYITKPFSVSILLRKISAILRRSTPIEAKNEIIYKDLIVDLNGMRVTIGNNNIDLTTKEYNIVVALFSNQGIVFTRNMLYDKIWGIDAFYDDSVINTHMGNLRKKLGVDYIKTVRGVGYKVEKLS